MSGVSSTNGSSSFFTDVPSTSFSYVTDDDLMAFCEVQLQGCDTQMQSLMSTQSDDVNNAQQLGAAQQALNQLATDVGEGNGQKLDANSNASDSNKTDASNWNTLLSTISTLQGCAASASDPVKSEIEAQIASLQSHITYDTNNNPTCIGTDLNQSDVTALAQNLQPDANTMSSDESMNMVKVNSAVDQREQMVQLVTGLIDKMNEMVTDVTSNIGK